MTATVGELLDVAPEVAMPNGSPHSVPNAQVRVRARVRVASTQRARKIPAAAAKAAVLGAAGTVRADLAGSWLLHNHLPSVAQLWSRRTPAKDAIPGGCDTPASHAMWVAEVVWRTTAVVLFVPVVAAMWLLHRGVTGVPTVLISAALVAMWFNSGGGAR